ncbi:MAG: glycosyl hydrolase family 28 protein [Lacrimispora sp.]|uniref:glycoside hydrolase family 28 protein n=1 Tax=Lacrimispora sp. TaxID=2719234 RepID=UPI0039E70D0B
MIQRIAGSGAIGDGKTVNTNMIQQAIDTCHEAGGGTVLLEHGTYVSGTLYLKSGVTLEIAVSAVLLASPDIRDYGKNTHYNRYKNETDMDRCFIYAEEQNDICIKGQGQINGNEGAFPNPGSIYRPMLMRFLRCSRIRLEGVRLIDSAAWNTAFLDSSYIWVRDVEIKNYRKYNGDGLNFDGCNNVFVYGCSITGTDDNLCLQASSREYPVENIHISNCEFTSICAAIRIGLKSIGDIRSVVVSNCTMKNVWKEGIKIECTEGGNISDISISNITMRSVSKPIYVLLNNRYEPDQPGNSIDLDHVPEIGTLKRLMFTNIIAADGPELFGPQYRFGKDIMGAPWFNGIRVDAEDNHKIEDLTFENIRYSSAGGVKLADIPETYPKVLDQLIYRDEIASGNYYPDWSRTAFLDIRNVKGLYLSNVAFDSQRTDERPAYLLEGCEIRKQEIYVQMKKEGN